MADIKTDIVTCRMMTDECLRLFQAGELGNESEYFYQVLYHLYNSKSRFNVKVSEDQIRKIK